jgi:3-deoxy-D-manno-octulosonic-acid transferase
VIIVDTFGELNRLYAIASVVFLGGSTYVRNVLGLGQNPIEPLAHRRPLFFGPVMNLWREITDELKAVWGGVEITGAKELARGIVRVFEDPVLARRMAEGAEKILAAHVDDVARNVRLVGRALSSERHTHRLLEAEEAVNDPVAQR